MKQDAANPPASGPDAPQHPRPVIPDHELVRRIDAGGYGEVWLARNVMGTYRAVKVVHRSRFTEERPYTREFEGVRNFEPISRLHESQVDILQVGCNDRDGYFYYVMELADDQRTGQQIDPDHYHPKTLRGELKQRGRLPVAECLKIGQALATALDQLHRHGLVHRDIKPSNIIFVNGQPKLTDIGLVTGADEQATFVGTEGYIAPEGPGTAQSDIYALGKVLYEMMTNLSPNESSGVALKEKYPSLPEGWDKAADFEELKELRHIVSRACEADAQERYQTTEEFRKELVLLEVGESITRRRRRERIAAWLRRNWLWGTMGLLLLSAGVSFWILEQRMAEETRRRELKDIQLARNGIRHAGWFTNNWSRLQHAAKTRMDQEVREQGSALLAGLDAHPMEVLAGAAAASAAFGLDGSVLIGGVGTNGLAMMIDTNGERIELPVRGEGPVCWATDGVPVQLVAVSNRLVLREARTGSTRRELSFAGMSRRVLAEPAALAITPGGGYVAAALTNRVFVWKATTGALLGEIAKEATDVEFSPDGSLLGVGSENGTTRVYAVPALTNVAVLPPALRGNPILCMAFGRDPLVRYGAVKRTNSWLLATGDQGAAIVVWDLNRRQPRSFYRGATWRVDALAFSPDGMTLASAGRNEPQLWDLMSGRLLLRLPFASSGESQALAFDATGRRLIVGGEPGGDGGSVVALWELEPDRGIWVLRGLASAARRVWFSADSKRVAALSDDWQLAVWDLGARRLLFLFETPVGVSADSAGGCFDASGERFAFATLHEACLFDLATGDTLQRWHLAGGLSDQLQFDAKGRLLLLRRERGRQQSKMIWRLYELAGVGNPGLLHEQAETNWSALDMAFVPGGDRFLVWDEGPENTKRTIHAYDVVSGGELWKDTTAVARGDLRVCLDPAGRWFGFTDYRPERLRLMRFSDFQQIGTAPGGYQGISPSGQQFAGVADYLSVFLDRTGPQHGIPLVTDWTGLAWVLAFSTDGNLLAWGTEEGAVIVADIPEVRRRLSELGDQRGHRPTAANQQAK